MGGSNSTAIYVLKCRCVHLFVRYNAVQTSAIGNSSEIANIQNKYK